MERAIIEKEIMRCLEQDFEVAHQEDQAMRMGYFAIAGYATINEQSVAIAVADLATHVTDDSVIASYFCGPVRGVGVWRPRTQS